MFQKAVIFFLCFLVSTLLPGQSSIRIQLEGIQGITIKEIKIPEFKEGFEIMVEQPLDHFNLSGKVFRQKDYLAWWSLIRNTF
jgi:hypothetical protein